VAKRAHFRVAALLLLSRMNKSKQLAGQSEEGPISLTYTHSSNPPFATP
jgi:hypothetical protein